MSTDADSNCVAETALRSSHAAHHPEEPARASQFLLNGSDPSSSQTKKGARQGSFSALPVFRGLFQYAKSKSESH
jgi:hypothetical protein